MFPIPKIIHLSYKSKEQIPKEWINVIPAWERTHKDGWQIKFWSDSDNDTLVTEKFPWFLDTYKNFKYKIQKCDAVRACYLYEYGGVYVDMDYMPLKNLDGLFENTDNDLYFTTSSTVAYFTNSFMASKPKQEFWKRYLESIINDKIPWYYTKHFNVMYSTGPMKIDQLIRDTRQVVGYIPAKVLHPCTVCNKQCDIENVYLRVLEGGSWNSVDSKLMNYVFCNWRDILLYTFLIIILIIIYIKYFNIKNDKLSALNKCIFY